MNEKALFDLSYATAADMEILAKLPKGRLLVNVLMGRNKNLLRGFVADANISQQNIAAYLASKGFCKDKLTQLFNLSDEEMKANANLVR